MKLKQGLLHSGEDLTMENQYNKPGSIIQYLFGVLLIVAIILAGVRYESKICELEMRLEILESESILSTYGIKNAEPLVISLMLLKISGIFTQNILLSRCVSDVESEKH